MLSTPSIESSLSVLPCIPARLVQVHVVGPAVEGRKALLSGTRTAATVAGAVRPGAVPRHTNEQGPVVTEIGRPPVLRLGHQRTQILLHGRQIEALKLFGIVEVLPHGVGQR